MSKKINMIYSKPQLGFFSQVETLRAMTHKYMADPHFMTFEERDEKEICRSYSYALFDDLKALCDRGEDISINAFRASLEKQGVTDSNFQNKVICMILQSKIGIHINLSSLLIDEICDSLCNGKKYNLFSAKRQVFLDVEKSDKVVLSIDDVLKEFNPDVEPLISVHISFSITPEMVSITEFSFIKISNNPIADDFYNSLEDNQSNILIRILLWIKRFFGFNAELRLEESASLQPTLS